MAKGLRVGAQVFNTALPPVCSYSIRWHPRVNFVALLDFECMFGKPEALAAPVKHHHVVAVTNPSFRRVVHLIENKKTSAISVSHVNLSFSIVPTERCVQVVERQV